MNILEHHIEEILDKRPLNSEESQEFLKEGWIPDEWIFVKWRYDCHGSKQTFEDYYRKDHWAKIEARGYALM